MKPYILLFLFVVSCVQKNDSPALLSSAKIINGVKVSSQTEADIALSIVGLTSEAGYFPECSGVLIAKNVVLSAAHCFNRQQEYIYLGPNITGTKEKSFENFIKIKNVIVHPDYNPKVNPFMAKSDLALVFLEEDVPSSHRPATVYSGSDLNSLSVFLIQSGLSLISSDNTKNIYSLISSIKGEWGYEQFYSNTHGSSPQINLNEFSKNRFKLLEDGSYFSVHTLFRATLPDTSGMNTLGPQDRIWTTSHLGSVTTGDSGGGLFVRINGNYYLAGINSIGFFDGTSRGLTSIATRVSDYSQWINEHLEKHQTSSQLLLKFFTEEEAVNQQGPIAECFSISKGMFDIAQESIDASKETSVLASELSPLVEECRKVCPDSGATKGFCSFYDGEDD